MSEPSSPPLSGPGPSSPSPPPETNVDDTNGDMGVVSLDSPTDPLPLVPENDDASQDFGHESPLPQTPNYQAANLPGEGKDAEHRSSTSSPVPRLASARTSSESLSSRRHQTVEPLFLSSARSARERDPSRTSSQNSHRSSSSIPRRQHTPSLSVTSMKAPSTPGVLASPRFRTIDVPHSITVSAEEEEEDLDPTAPFESVSLDDTPAVVPTHHARLSTSSAREAGPGAPGSPGRGELPERPRSVGLGLHMGHERSSSRASASSFKVSILPNGKRISESKSRPTSPITPASATFASGSSTPRRHAPPAHPHPFPIPVSPLPSNVPVPQVTDPSAGPSKSPHLGPGGASVPTPGHALGVKGPSAFDKFMSRTRPSHLPPKDKVEDETHLHEWETMMSKAREHEAERRRIQEARRLEREKHLLAVTPRWEVLLRDRDCIPKIKKSETDRKLWFEGVPPHLRGRAWSLAIGNALAMHKDAYNMYLKRAKRAIDNGRFPPDIQNQMEEDLDNTLPILHVFQKGSPVRDDLRDLVSAWVVYRSDEGLGYAPYITCLAAMFILVSPPQEAFLSLCNLLARPCMHAFFTETQDEIDAFYRVFENLQADMFPRIYANCKNLGLRLPESYFRSVLVEQVPFDAALRLWDQIVLEGDGYIFRAALAIFAFLEPRLYYPDKEEIESVLEGRNAATMAIAERERERARLRGEQYEEALDGKLSVYGLHEDALFDWLANDGWRDSRFERLVMRELPD